jgi:hypothetical protein
VSAHRYWRINILACDAGIYGALQNLTMATGQGGANILPPGSGGYSASSSQSGHGPEQAIGSGYFGGAGPLPVQWWVDLEGTGQGGAADIVEVTMTPTSGYQTYFPSTWNLDWSDDASTWTAAAAFTAATWAAGATQTFDVSPPNIVPTIVQSAFVRGETSPLNLTLAASPTNGNILLLIITGWSQPLTVPSGFINIQSDNQVSHANQGSWTYWCPADGAATSFSFTGASDWHNIALYELTNASEPLITAFGACSNIGSSPISSGSLVPHSTTSLRFLTFEWDGASARPTTPTGWTLETPSAWIVPSTGNHSGCTWLIPPDSSGTQAVAFAPTESYSTVWLDVTVPGVYVPGVVVPGGAINFTGFAPTTSGGVQSATAIVQSAFDAGNSGSLTLTLGAAPAIGNTLLLVVTGFGSDVSNITTPSGYTAVYSNASLYQGFWIFTQEVASSLSTSLTVSVSDTNWTRAGLFELVNVTGAITAAAASEFSSSPNTTSLSSESGDGLRLLCFEVDGTLTAATPLGYTLLSPLAWQGGTDGGNHNAVIYSISPTTSGVQSADNTASGGSFALWGVVDVPGTEPGIIAAPGPGTINFTGFAPTTSVISGHPPMFSVIV